MAKQVSIHLVYATSTVTTSIKKLTDSIGKIMAYGVCEVINLSDNITNNVLLGQTSTLNAVLEFNIDDTKIQTRNDRDNAINKQEAYQFLMVTLNDVFREGGYAYFEFNSQNQCELSSEADKEDGDILAF